MSTPTELSYREIPLTKGQVALVDAVHYDFLMQWSWTAAFRKTIGSFYAVRSTRVNGRTREILMHREILGLHHGDQRQGDHVFHNTLDNRLMVDGKENLRIATRSQNQHNTRKQKNNTSGFKGVSLHAKTGLYRACIGSAGKVITLGYRRTAEAAYLELYLPAATEKQGRFRDDNRPNCSPLPCA